MGDVISFFKYRYPIWAKSQITIYMYTGDGLWCSTPLSICNISITKCISRR